MNDFNDFNQQIIAEFRANGGVVGGGFAGLPMTILTTTGAKSGQPRTAPLVCLPEDGRLLIFGSKGGAPTHPDWYHNLVANPTVTVEYGDRTFETTAEVLTGSDRDAAYARQVAAVPTFAEYEKNAGDRVIPVVALPLPD